MLVLQNILEVFAYTKVAKLVISFGDIKEAGWYHKNNFNKTSLFVWYYLFVT